MPRAWDTSTRRPARLASISKRCATDPPISTNTSTRSPFTFARLSRVAHSRSHVRVAGAVTALARSWPDRLESCPTQKATRLWSRPRPWRQLPLGPLPKVGCRRRCSQRGFAVRRAIGEAGLTVDQGRTLGRGLGPRPRPLRRAWTWPLQLFGGLPQPCKGRRSSCERQLVQETHDLPRGRPQPTPRGHDACPRSQGSLNRAALRHGGLKQGHTRILPVDGVYDERGQGDARLQGLVPQQLVHTTRILPR